MFDHKYKYSPFILIGAFNAVYGAFLIVMILLKLFGNSIPKKFEEIEEKMISEEQNKGEFKID